MILVQLAQVASRQGRVDDALALIAEARPLLPSPGPAVLDAVAADALSRVWRWQEAIAPARACAERAPANSGAWVALARALGSTGDDLGALDAAARASSSHRATPTCCAPRPPRSQPCITPTPTPRSPPTTAPLARPRRRAPHLLRLRFVALRPRARAGPHARATSDRRPVTQGEVTTTRSRR